MHEYTNREAEAQIGINQNFENFLPIQTPIKQKNFLSVAEVWYISFQWKDKMLVQVLR